MNKAIYIFILCLSFFGYSQNYNGKISDVKVSGLNQITIAPNIRAVAKDDLRYMKILDSKNNQVPYALVAYKSLAESFSPFKIVSQISIPDSITTLVLQNEKASKISKFTLQIENTSLTKTYNVSGSNDGITWFGLLENQTLTDLAKNDATSVFKTITFPSNTYGYLRIVMNDKNSLPLNIRSVGIAETQLIPQKLVPIDDFKYKITEDKIRKITRITFTATNKHQIDAVAFEITTKYFSRYAKLVVKRKRNSKLRESIYDEVLTNFTLNSKQSTTFFVDAIIEKSFTIEIENHDNKPLDISAVQVLQKPITVVSELKSGENYKVFVDTTYSKPRYDLEEFVAESAVNFPKVSISNFKKNKIEIAESSEKAFWQSSLFMWICIIIGGILVAYFAMGLLKDMRE